MARRRTFRMLPYRSQERFHADFVRDESHGYVELHGGWIAAPDIEGDAGVALLFRPLADVVIQRLANARAAAFFIHADVVDVEGAHGGENVVVHGRDVRAKGISQHLAVLVRGGENGLGRVAQYRRHILRRILPRVGTEEIGTSVIVHLFHLQEQLGETRDVALRRGSDLYRMPFHILFLLLSARTVEGVSAPYGSFAAMLVRSSLQAAEELFPSSFP